MKYKQTIAAILGMLLLAGCEMNEAEPKAHDVLEVVNVDILIQEEIAVNDEVTLQVKVTQGEDDVEDAQEVEFEIWKHDHRDDGEMITGIHQGEGVYQISHTFEQDGIYYVQTHVTARGMHVMPTKQLLIGDVSEEELASLEEESGETESSHHGHH
ncbi:FixH family protein [Alkalihalobacterium bogoriense]|uniref:FixH family protein n=1 Tax=Alkalihalobacterium bogoriense TaxID=246272 RepID=UPI00047BBBB0|nr:FixH family protein [Alkalihalobacterium bogoriense]